MDKKHLKLSSRYNFGEKVNLNILGNIIKSTNEESIFIVGISFTESKVYYDIQIGNENCYSILNHVDSCFVEDLK